MATERARAACGHRAALAALVLLLATGLAPAPAFATPVRVAVERNVPDEAQVEAAFLVNFLRYTQWPASSFESAAAPFVVTVVGEERAYVAMRLVAAAAGPVQGRPIEVRWLPDGRGSRAAPFDSPQDTEARLQMRRSHLVFFHRSAGPVHAQVLADLAHLPVLTVSDRDGFTAAGGMLGLVRQDRRILFQANPGAIRNGGLLVSAKVLKLARAGARSSP